MAFQVAYTASNIFMKNEIFPFYSKTVLKQTFFEENLCYYYCVCSFFILCDCFSLINEATLVIQGKTKKMKLYFGFDYTKNTIKEPKSAISSKALELSKCKSFYNKVK